MYRTDTITSDEILATLKQLHKDDHTAEELWLSDHSRIDLWAISPSMANGNKAYSYEIKTNLPDFKRDNAIKQRGARLLSDYFYYVAPMNVIPREMVPDWAGLYEVKWHCEYNNTPYLQLTKSLQAPKRDKDTPTWSLVASMIQNVKRNLKND